MISRANVEALISFYYNPYNLLYLAKYLEKQHYKSEWNMKNLNYKAVSGELCIKKAQQLYFSPVVLLLTTLIIFISM